MGLNGANISLSINKCNGANKLVCKKPMSNKDNNNSGTSLGEQQASCSKEADLGIKARLGRIATVNSRTIRNLYDEVLENTKCEVTKCEVTKCEVENCLREVSTDSWTLNQQLSIALYGIKNGKLENTKDDIELIKPFLKTPSDDPKDQKAQCELATALVKKEMLTKDDIELIKPFLEKLSDDPKAQKAQYELATALVEKKMLIRDDKQLGSSLGQLLKKGSHKDAEEFAAHVNLYTALIKTGYLQCKDTAFKIVTKCLQSKNFNDNDTVLAAKCNLVAVAVNKEILTNNDEDKNLIAPLVRSLKNAKTNYPAKCNLAKALVEKEIVPKEEIGSLLKKDCNDNAEKFAAKLNLYTALIGQWDTEKARTDKILRAKVTKYLEKTTFGHNDTVLAAKCNLAAVAVNKEILTKDDIELIKPFLKTPSDDPNALKAQCQLATALVKKGILTNNDKDKDLITNLVHALGSNTAYTAKCDLVIALVEKKMLIKNDEKLGSSLLLLLEKDCKNNAEEFAAHLNIYTALIKIGYLQRTATDTNDKAFEIVTHCLQKEVFKDNDTVLAARCNLAAVAVNKEILTKDDKKLIKPFLKTPSDDPEAQKAQMNLAAVAVNKEILTEDNIMTIQSLAMRLTDAKTNYPAKCNLVIAFVEKKMLGEESVDALLKPLLIKDCNDNVEESAAQLNLAKALVEKEMLYDGVDALIKPLLSKDCNEPKDEFSI